MKKLLSLLVLMAVGAQAAPSLDHTVFDARNETTSLAEFRGRWCMSIFGHLGVCLAVSHFLG